MVSRESVCWQLEKPNLPFENKRASPPKELAMSNFSCSIAFKRSFVNRFFFLLYQILSPSFVCTRFPAATRSFPEGAANPQNGCLEAFLLSGGENDRNKRTAVDENRNCRILCTNPLTNAVLSFIMAP